MRISLIAGTFVALRMNPSPTYETPDGRMRIVPLAEVRRWEGWQRAMSGGLKDHRYYEIVAETLGFDCRAAVLEDRASALRAVQPFFFAEQDLLITAPKLVRTPVAWMRKIFPRFLRLRMLMVGCAAGEGRLGAEPDQQRWVVQNMRAAFLKVAREEKAAIVVWKDFPTSYRGAMAALKGPPEAAHTSRFRACQRQPCPWISRTSMNT